MFLHHLIVHAHLHLTGCPLKSSDPTHPLTHIPLTHPLTLSLTFHSHPLSHSRFTYTHFLFLSLSLTGVCRGRDDGYLSSHRLCFVVESDRIRYTLCQVITLILYHTTH